MLTNAPPLGLAGCNRQLLAANVLMLTVLTQRVERQGRLERGDVMTRGVAGRQLYRQQKPTPK